MSRRKSSSAFAARFRYDERRNARMRAARPEATAAVLFRSARRSGTFTMPRRTGAMVVLAEQEERSDLPALMATITGIAAFPLAGVAVLGDVVSPLSFAVIAAIAGCVVFVALARLEPSS